MQAVASWERGPQRARSCGPPPRRCAVSPTTPARILMVILFILIKNENEDGEASFSRLIKLTCGGDVLRAELYTAAADSVLLLGKLRYKHVVGLSGL